MMVEELIRLLKREMKPALGVTEVGAIALASARAAALVEGDILGVEVAVNGGLYKNAFSCAIPSTGKTGSVLAAAIGAVAGDYEKDLEALEGITPLDVEKAEALVNRGAVHVDVDEKEKEIYVCAKVRKKNGVGTALIRKYHNRFVLLKKGDEVLFEANDIENKEDDFDFENVNVDMLVDFAQSVPFEDIDFLQEMINMNEALSKAGANGMGLGISHTLNAFQKLRILSEDMIYKAQSLTCDALDARLSGLSLPAMSIAGSGSHGIVCSLPVISYGKSKGLPQEAIVRALALSCLVTVYSKHYSGRLSPLCGCVIGGGSGAAAGIVLLMGGSKEQVGHAINHLAASLTGMICDGGSIGCVLKASSGIYTVFLSAMLAMQGVTMPPNFGILGSNVEQTIRNIGRISAQGMSNTDAVTLALMKEGK